MSHEKMNKFIIRMSIYVVLMVAIVSIANLYQASVAPSVTDKIALKQMNDTDEGHIAMRAYTHTTNNSYIIPTIGVILYIIIVGRSTKSLLYSKEDTK